MWCLETLEKINKELFKCGDAKLAYERAGIPILKQCPRLKEMPEVVNEWQMHTYCPDCKGYCNGKCKNEKCIFEGKKVPIKEI